jgi:hypothetical protein
MENIDVNELVNAYVNIRNARHALLKKFEGEDGVLKLELEQIEGALLSVCNSTNADSIRTESGTAIRKLNERFYCTDWDNFKTFVKENDALDLFEKRIHQENFKTFLNGHSRDGLPPGVNVIKKFTVIVRKSNSQE